MKRAAQILITFVLLAVAAAGAQSLGDYARSVRKDKSTSTAASKHYDNDNLPKTEHLSIVGPPPTQTADSGESKTGRTGPGKRDQDRWQWTGRRFRECFERRSRRSPENAGRMEEATRGSKDADRVRREGLGSLESRISTTRCSDVC